MPYSQAQPAHIASVAIGSVAFGLSGLWAQWPLGSVAFGLSGLWAQWLSGLASVAWPLIWLKLANSLYLSFFFFFFGF